MAKTPALRYENLIRYIIKYKPQSIMEIGVWDGRTAKKMIEAALRHHNEVRYIGFDLFEDITDKEIVAEQSKTTKANYNNVRSLLEKIPYADVELYKGYTKDTIPLVPTELIDFIFIDGGHSPETIKSDWTNIQRFIHGKTVIIFDDYWEGRTDFGCKKLIDDLKLRDVNWDIALLNPVDIFPEKRIRMVRVIRKF